MRFPGRNVSSPYLLAFCVYTLAAVSLHAEAATRPEAGNHDGKPVPRGTLFQKENPKEIFNKKVAEVDRYGIVMLRAKQEEVEKEKKPESVLSGDVQVKVPESREDILKQFGSPEEETPVLAQDNAPKPFKAMMAALNIGDEELAYEYSKQWVQYMGKIDKVALNVTGLTGKAMERFGKMDAEKGWANDEHYNKYNKLVDSDLKQDLSQPNTSVVNLLDYLTQNLRDEISSQRTFDSEGEDLFYSEEKSRQKIREALGKKLPSVGNTRIDIYFFFDPEDEKSLLMAREAQKIHEDAKSNRNHNFIAVSRKKISKEAYAKYRYATGVFFPAIIGGSSLPNMFEVASVPEIVIHVPEKKITIHEQGLRKAFYIEEVKNILSRREDA